MSYLVSQDTKFGDTRSDEGAARRICVSHIPSNTSVRDIMKLFGPDRIEGVTINNKNPHFVFAFVQFKRPDGKTEALLMNETVFMGKKIAVRNYTDKPKPTDTEARERRRQDFEAREVKPKLEPPPYRSTKQSSSRSPHSSRHRRSSSNGRNGSRGRESTSARSRPDSSNHRRSGSPIRKQFCASPGQSHVSARDRDWDFIRSEHSEASAKHLSSRDYHRNRSPAHSRRRSRSRSRSRSPAPSLSIASEIYRQAARNVVRSPTKPKNPFSLGHSPGHSNDNNGGFLRGPSSSALSLWKPDTERHSSGLAPASFQVPTSSTMKSTTIGFTTAPKNGLIRTSTNGMVDDQVSQATNETQSTMDASGSRDMPPDVKLPLEMALMDGTALNLSVFQINKIIQYFEMSRLKIERPSLAMQPSEPYVTEPPSITSGDSAPDEDELAHRVADKFSSINRKIRR